MEMKERKGLKGGYYKTLASWTRGQFPSSSSVPFPATRGGSWLGSLAWLWYRKKRYWAMGLGSLCFKVKGAEGYKVLIPPDSLGELVEKESSLPWQEDFRIWQW